MPFREIWKAFFYARHRGLPVLVIAKNAVMKQSQRSLKQAGDCFRKLRNLAVTIIPAPSNDEVA